MVGKKLSSVTQIVHKSWCEGVNCPNGCHNSNVQTCLHGKSNCCRHDVKYSNDKHCADYNPHHFFLVVFSVRKLQKVVALSAWLALFACKVENRCNKRAWVEIYYSLHTKRADISESPVLNSVCDAAQKGKNWPRIPQPVLLLFFFLSFKNDSLKFSLNFSRCFWHAFFVLSRFELCFIFLLLIWCPSTITRGWV